MHETHSPAARPKPLINMKLLDPGVLLSAAEAARNARTLVAELVLAAGEAGYRHGDELERRLLADRADSTTVTMVHEAMALLRRAVAPGTSPSPKGPKA